MAEKTKDELLHDHNKDGIDRHGFLKCMAWAGTGALCVMQGGVLKSYSLSQMSQMGSKPTNTPQKCRVSQADTPLNSRQSCS
jgi:3',5'-cyclic-AMP phosphodiesterase